MRKTSWIAAILCVAAPLAAGADEFSFKRVRVGDSLPGKRITVQIDPEEQARYLAALQADLERADIHPWAWVVNSSLAAAKPTSSLLAHRAAAESPHLARVGSLAPRTAVIPLLADEPVGVERLRSLVPQSKSKDDPVTDAEKTKPSVLFVCVHNAGRSQMGAAYPTHLSGGAVEVRSAGSAPAETINPAVREAMLEEGIDISAEKPKILTTEAVQASDVVITMGCGDTLSLIHISEPTRPY